MNYFEFYGIEESFNVDAAIIKQKFYELSKKYHPDFYANEGDEKQQEILDLSTQNNKAYQVLSNPAKRLEYILQLHGLLVEGGKYQLDPEFLMEMMEINESLMEVENNSQLNEIKTKMETFEAHLQAQLNTLISQYDAAAQHQAESILNEIKDIYYRQKYLLRIKDSLNTFAARL
jgi:molecular chaperone HscB